MALLGARDRLDRLERLEDRLRVRVEAPVGGLLARVAPGDREHLLAGSHEVLDHAPPGRHVGHVVLVDHRRDEQERRLADLRRRRLVLQELEHGRAQHHRAGCHRHVLADLERGLVDHARNPRRPRHVAQQRARAAHEVGPTVVERGLEHGRVGEREVGRRRGVEHVLDGEAHTPFRARVEPGVGDQLVDRLARRQVGLRQPAEGGIARPRGVLEAAVALGGGERGAPGGDPADLRRQAHAAPRDAVGAHGQARGEASARDPREPPAP